MELVATDASRITFLTQVVRPAGPVYLPDAAIKLAQRYSFAKVPSLEELTRNSYAFSIGKFKDVQIDELQIYPDGIIVSSRTNTEVLDAFISDVLSWSEKEFGYVQASTAKPEKFIESAILVKSEKDLALTLSPRNDVAEIVKRRLRENVTDVPYQLAGFTFDCDPAAFPGRRKPLRFGLERRVNVPFSENVFYSVAPLHTQVHLMLLSDLEALPIPAESCAPESA